MFSECLFLVVLFTPLPWPGSHINLKTWNGLCPGMEREQVFRILGGQPKDYRLYRDPQLDELFFFADHRYFDYTHYWLSDFGRIGLRFDSRGKLEGKRFTTFSCPEGIPLSKVIQYHLWRTINAAPDPFEREATMQGTGNH